MNPEKWEAVDTMDSSSGVMVSNLPLIFAHGEPISLNNMTLAELEVFIPFMVRCSVGEELKTVWSQLPRPLWWPNRLPFRVPSASTPQTTKSLMVRLVERCYAFHGCQYLLQFCTSLQLMKSSAGYRFTDNRDGTTSMFDGPTGKLLVTFRNENRDYDKAVAKPKNAVSHQKKLLLVNHQSNSSKNDAMVRKSISDVYLCDKCDDEFISLKEVLAHEKQCKGNRPPTPPMPSPEPEILDDEEETAEQVPFLSYLGLEPAKHTGVAPYTSPRKKQQQQPPLMKKTFNQGLLRFDSIDITSPLGLYVMSKSKYGGKLQMPEHFVSRYERHVIASEADLVATRERCSSRWYVVWRPRKEEQPWVHLYCFTSVERREKQITLQTGLDKRSRRLLSKCKKARIKIKRLAKRVIDRATRLEGGRSIPCIDLTAGEENKPCSSSSYSSPSAPNSASPRTSSSTTTSLKRQISTSSFSSSKRQTLPRPSSRQPCNNNNNTSNETPTDQPKVESQDPLDPLHIAAPSPKKISNIQSLDYKNYVSEPLDDALNCLPDTTRHSLNELSNNGVTVTSLYYPDESQPDGEDDSCFPRSESPGLPRVSNFSLGVHNNIASIWPVHSVFNENIVAPEEYLMGTDPSVAAYDLGAHPPNFLLPQASSGATAYESFANSEHSVEVIELSSDEDDPGVVDRSYARSKNGYSHWSLKKHSKYGRDKRCPVANGTTHKSVPPQPINTTSFYSCSSINFPISNSLDGKLMNKFSDNINDSKDNSDKNNSDYKSKNSLPMDINYYYQVLNQEPYKSFSRDADYSSSHHQTRVLPSLIPHLMVDNEGCIKTPVQIDEDISFNVRLTNPISPRLTNPVSPNHSDKMDKCDGGTPFSCHQNNNNNNSLFYNISNKFNKSILYLTSFVKSKMLEGSSLYPELYGTDKVTSEGQFTHKKPECQNQQAKRNKKRASEINFLTMDECRELKRKGIGVLKHLNNGEKKVITRCLAKKNSLQTRNSKFQRTLYTLDQPKKKPVKSVSSSNRTTGTDIFCEPAIYPCADNDMSSKSDSSSFNTRCKEIDFSDIKLTNTDHQKIYFNQIDSERKRIHTLLPKRADTQKKFLIMDENKNYQNMAGKEIKRPKLSRELSSLTRDECKELKGMGFHPADILGSGDHPTLYYESDDGRLSPCVKRRPSLISFKSPSGKNGPRNETQFECRDSTKQMMQGNKKLSRELSKLMVDEWKELKRANAHPSQVSGLLSMQRNVRSCSSFRRKEETTPPARLSPENYTFSLGRCSRTQEKALSSPTLMSPRMSHRKLLHTERGMCVLGYTMTNPT